MKHYAAFLTILFLAIFFIPVESRTGGPFGLGFVVGDPTGLTMKIWTGKERAITAAMAFGTSHNRSDAIYLNVMHNWHDFNLAPVEYGQLPFYLGLGGRLWSGNDDFTLGVRGVGGVSYMPPRSPVDIFLEIGVCIDFVGNTGGDADMGLGLHYYF